MSTSYDRQKNIDVVEENTWRRCRIRDSQNKFWNVLLLEGETLKGDYIREGGKGICTQCLMVKVYVNPL